jgi:zinc transporter ZupT
VLALTLRENSRAIAGGIGFSAAIMILISLLELIPKAVDAAGARSLDPNQPVWDAIK